MSLPLISLMNNTKWNEIRLAVYAMGESVPRWRTKTLKSGFISDWESDWFYHFSNGGYKDIEWLEIEFTTEEQKNSILKILRNIHVPGVAEKSCFKVFGYISSGTAVDYL